VAKRSPVTTTKPQRPVEYYPPAPEEIDQYALTVCRELGEKIDSNYNSPDIRRELAGFLKVVASICSKQLNKSSDGVLDKDQTQR
jgi:hypothetical protein